MAEDNFKVQYKQKSHCTTSPKVFHDTGWNVRPSTPAMGSGSFGNEGRPQSISWQPWFSFPTCKNTPVALSLRLNFLGFGQIKPYCCASGINTMLANVRWGSKQHGCYQWTMPDIYLCFFMLRLESPDGLSNVFLLTPELCFLRNAITFGGSANIRWFPRMHRAELEDNANHDMMMQTLKVIWR